ncbi:hypothetical protein D3C85_1330270 [compost metagenome]
MYRAANLLRARRVERWRIAEMGRALENALEACAANWFGTMVVLVADILVNANRESGSLRIGVLFFLLGDPIVLNFFHYQSSG